MKNKGLGRFVTARTVSILGDRLAETVLPIVILLATGDALLAGLVTAANVAPTFLLSLPIGHWVDLRERRRLMTSADLWRAVLSVGLAVALFDPNPSALILVLISFLLGCGDVLFNVSAQSYLPALVPSTRIMRANTVLETGDAAATLAGPAVAGAVLTRLSGSAAIAMNAASFLASALLLLRLPDSRPGEKTEARETETGEDAAPQRLGRTEMLAGVRLLIKDPTQRLLQIGGAYLYLAAGAAGVTIISLAVQELHLSKLQVGLVLSGAGIGGLAVGFLVARVVERAPWGPLLGISLLGIALTCIWLAVTGSFGGAFVAVLLMDGCSALAFITAGSARQIFTPADRIGRLTAATGIVNGAVRTLGAAGGGAFVLAFGARKALLALGFCGIAAATPLLLARVARVSMNRASGTAEPAEAAPSASS
ncbi:MFS transporter [Streptomyces goshikiensis]|uniref:MFS transporter n=1 Tax=Streptomyces goshikiensis TaxID=1942 RepID=UPI0036D9527C